MTTSPPPSSPPPPSGATKVILPPPIDVQAERATAVRTVQRPHSANTSPLISRKSTPDVIKATLMSDSTVNSPSSASTTSSYAMSPSVGGSSDVSSPFSTPPPHQAKAPLRSSSSSSSSGAQEAPHPQVPVLKSIRSQPDLSSPRLRQLEDELFFPHHSPKKKYSHDFSDPTATGERPHKPKGEWQPYSAVAGPFLTGPLSAEKRPEPATKIPPSNPKKDLEIIDQSATGLLFPVAPVFPTPSSVNAQGQLVWDPSTLPSTSTLPAQNVLAQPRMSLVPTAFQGYSPLKMQQNSNGPATPATSQWNHSSTSTKSSNATSSAPPCIPPVPLYPVSGTSSSPKPASPRSAVVPTTNSVSPLKNQQYSPRKATSSFHSPGISDDTFSFSSYDAAPSGSPSQDSQFSTDSYNYSSPQSYNAPPQSDTQARPHSAPSPSIYSGYHGYSSYGVSESFLSPPPLFNTSLAQQPSIQSSLSAEFDAVATTSTSYPLTPQYQSGSSSNHNTSNMKTASGSAATPLRHRVVTNLVSGAETVSTAVLSPGSKNVHETILNRYGLTHDTFDQLANGMAESMTKALSQTKAGRTHREVELTCLIQKVQTQLKIMGRVSTDIREEYRSSSSKLVQSKAENKLLASANVQLKLLVEQLRHERQFFHQHFLQGQQAQSILLRESITNLHRSIEECKRQTQDIGTTVLKELALSSKDSPTVMRLDKGLDVVKAMLEDLEERVRQAAGSGVPLPPSSRTRDLANRGVSTASPHKDPSAGLSSWSRNVALAMMGCLFWLSSIAGVYYYASSSSAMASVEQQQMQQTQSPSRLLEQDMERLVDRVVKTLESKNGASTPSSMGHIEPHIMIGRPSVEPGFDVSSPHDFFPRDSPLPEVEVVKRKLDFALTPEEIEKESRRQQVKSRLSLNPMGATVSKETGQIKIQKDLKVEANAQVLVQNMMLERNVVEQEKVPAVNTAQAEIVSTLIEPNGEMKVIGKETNELPSSVIGGLKSGNIVSNQTSSLEKVVVKSSSDKAKTTKSSENNESVEVMSTGVDVSAPALAQIGSVPSSKRTEDDMKALSTQTVQTVERVEVEKNKIEVEIKQLEKATVFSTGSHFVSKIDPHTTDLDELNQKPLTEKVAANDGCHAQLPLVSKSCVASSDLQVEPKKQVPSQVTYSTKSAVQDKKKVPVSSNMSLGNSNIDATMKSSNKIIEKPLKFDGTIALAHPEAVAPKKTDVKESKQNTVVAEAKKKENEVKSLPSSSSNISTEQVITPKPIESQVMKFDSKSLGLDGSAPKVDISVPSAVQKDATKPKSPMLCLHNDSTVCGIPSDENEKTVKKNVKASKDSKQTQPVKVENPKEESKPIVSIPVRKEAKDDLEEAVEEEVEEEEASSAEADPSKSSAAPLSAFGEALKSLGKMYVDRQVHHATPTHIENGNDEDADDEEGNDEAEEQTETGTMDTDELQKNSKILAETSPVWHDLTKEIESSSDKDPKAHAVTKTPMTEKKSTLDGSSLQQEKQPKDEKIPITNTSFTPVDEKHFSKKTAEKEVQIELVVPPKDSTFSTSFLAEEHESSRLSSVVPVEEVVVSKTEQQLQESIPPHPAMVIPETIRTRTEASQEDTKKETIEVKEDLEMTYLLPPPTTTDENELVASLVDSSTETKDISTSVPFKAPTEREMKKSSKSSTTSTIEEKVYFKNQSIQVPQAPVKAQEKEETSQIVSEVALRKKKVPSLVEWSVEDFFGKQQDAVDMKDKKEDDDEEEVNDDSHVLIVVPTDDAKKVVVQEDDQAEKDDTPSWTVSDFVGNFEPVAMAKDDKITTLEESKEKKQEAKWPMSALNESFETTSPVLAEKFSTDKGKMDFDPPSEVVKSSVKLDDKAESEKREKEEWQMSPLNGSEAVASVNSKEKFSFDGSKIDVQPEIKEKVPAVVEEPAKMKKSIEKEAHPSLNSCPNSLDESFMETSIEKKGENQYVKQQLPTLQQNSDDKEPLVVEQPSCDATVAEIFQDTKSKQEEEQVAESFGEEMKKMDPIGKLAASLESIVQSVDPAKAESDEEAVTEAQAQAARIAEAYKRPSRIPRNPAGSRPLNRATTSKDEKPSQIPQPPTQRNAPLSNDGPIRNPANVDNMAQRRQARR